MATKNKKSKKTLQKIKVAELFAGVGGFRLGLEGWKGKSPLSQYKKAMNPQFEVVWSNQWEPASNKQYASDVYVERFGDLHHSNQDIAKVNVNDIPDHDLLVGGFPCQDYSVARTLSQSGGLEGKKGVLWWQIHRIVKDKKNPPKYLFLENVDRLLKSPAKQRGRDFAIMLASLADLGYIVEWRVINAADYGLPQRRRRIFFLAYHESTMVHKRIIKNDKPVDWVIAEGPFAQAFPMVANVQTDLVPHILDRDLVKISETFNKETRSGKSPFENAGIMIKHRYWTFPVKSAFSGKRIVLDDIIEKDDAMVPKSFFIDKESLPRWKYLKGAKKEPRRNKATGFEYTYNEGPMVFPDPLDKPARTIITGEGGATPSRFKHVIKTPKGKLRRLMPLELERINMFPDHHTEGATDGKRAFFMGNALVVGIIEKVGQQL
ncbi:MAG: DNA (cytosine-5-)-methyltransferase, partial [Bacteroidetes bacterium]|nr:DNA (cytosine-5-)-methyltransferase [Bacteroidota bacterium]